MRQRGSCYLYTIVFLCPISLHIRGPFNYGVVSNFKDFVNGRISEMLACWLVSGTSRCQKLELYGAYSSLPVAISPSQHDGASGLSEAYMNDAIYLGCGLLSLGVITAIDNGSLIFVLCIWLCLHSLNYPILENDSLRRRLAGGE